MRRYAISGSYDDRDCKNSINGDLGTPSPGAWTRGHGTPNPQPYFALVFFVVFSIIAALILLSMFIGAKEMIYLLLLMRVLIS